MKNPQDYLIFLTETDKGLIGIGELKEVEEREKPEKGYNKTYGHHIYKFSEVLLLEKLIHLTSGIAPRHALEGVCTKKHFLISELKKQNIKIK